MDIYKSDVVKFKESVVWRSMREEMSMAEEGLLSTLKHLDPITHATDMARTQGRLEAIESFLDMPDELYEQALEERAKEQVEERDEE